MTITRNQLQILQHSVGADQYGRGGGYRSHFCTSPDCQDGRDCESLVEIGMMEKGTPSEITGGDTPYFVTAAGKLAISELSPKPPVLSRSQKRYQEYLSADSELSFMEWLKRRSRKTA